jgi:hypothetical protein
LKAGAGAWEEDDSGRCIICSVRWADTLLVHAGEGHMCVCHECSYLLPLQAGCPICRQPIELMVRVAG